MYKIQLFFFLLENQNKLKYPGLTNDGIDIILDFDLNAFDDSSDEFYDSPGYIPDELQNDNSENEEVENKKSSGKGDSHKHYLNNPEIDAKTQKDNNLSNDHFEVSRSITNFKQKLVKNKRVFCLYCEELFTNFPRHLDRKHPLEEDVRKILVMS